jgi:type I site-specific restriction-modification system R (restriction) subunit
MTNALMVISDGWSARAGSLTSDYNRFMAWKTANGRTLVDSQSESELTDRQKRFAKWTSKEAVVGSQSRLEQVAADLITHFEARRAAADGKGMIVCMSHRVCVALHNQIIQLRPEWYDPDDTKGAIKIIMTGSASDPLAWQEHIRNQPRRKALGDRLRVRTAVWLSISIGRGTAVFG